MSTHKYLDDNGLLYLWGKLKAAFLSAISYDSTNKKIQITKNGTTTDLVTAAKIVEDGGGVTDISGKADKVQSATSGNFAALDSNGNLVDSNKSAASFAAPATTLAGYGINDAYTKAETDAKFSGVYKPSGNITASELTSSLLVVGNVGKVWNLTTDATTTSDWTEGAGKTVKTGTDVGVVEVDDNGTTVYKFNAFSMGIDLSGYVQESDLVAITNAEIDTIVAS